MRRFVTVLVAAVVVTATPAGAAVAQTRNSPAYLPPVEAPLTDTFRPPATPYGPGNRGIDYATVDQQPVTAAADGEVTFAGRVGNEVHVVVLHADGIRTSYSFLASAEVHRGDRVEQGQRVGTAAATGLHFGARAGGNYIDPLSLFRATKTHAYLVDDDERKPLSELVERQGLIAGLPDRVREAVAGGAAWVRGRAVATYDKYVDLARLIADGLIDLSIPIPVHLAVAAVRWEAAQKTCTPANAPVPGPAEIQAPPGERIVILVGGLASSTGHGAILDVDTSALGYRAQNVVQFDYRSDGQPYGPDDTLGDIAAAGRRLALQIAEIQRRHPGARVDVLAHSMGGLVARSAVTRFGATPTTLVTMATPHQGADLASAAAGISGSQSGGRALGSFGQAQLGGIDPQAVAVLQMAETSDFLLDLRRNGRWPPPAVTRVATIGGRGDLTVPSHQSRLGGIEGTVVTPFGAASIADHDRLPGSPEAMTEIARTLAGQSLTCQRLSDTLLDEMTSRQVADVEDRLGLALTAAGLYGDYRRRSPLDADPLDNGNRPLGPSR